MVLPDRFPKNPEEYMRVEMPLVPQPLIESSKALDKKELTNSSSMDGEAAEKSQPFLASGFGSCGTYSVSSLRAAVDYHAKFLTVAESNLQAAQHAPTIPQAILDRFSRR